MSVIPPGGQAPFAEFIAKPPGQLQASLGGGLTNQTPPTPQFKFGGGGGTPPPTDVAGEAFSKTPAGFAASAGVGVLGSLFGAAAERKKQQRELAQKQQEQGMAAQRSGIQKMTTGQMTALQNIVNSFGRALNV